MILNGFERRAIEFHNKRNFKGYPPLKFHVQKGGDIHIYIVDSRWKAGPKNAHNDLCALRYPPPCAFKKPLWWKGVLPTAAMTPSAISCRIDRATTFSPAGTSAPWAWTAGTAGSAGSAWMAWSSPAPPSSRAGSAGSSSSPSSIKGASPWITAASAASIASTASAIAAATLAMRQRLDSWSSLNSCGNGLACWWMPHDMNEAPQSWQWPTLLKTCSSANTFLIKSITMQLKANQQRRHYNQYLKLRTGDQSLEVRHPPAHASLLDCKAANGGAKEMASARLSMAWTAWTASGAIKWTESIANQPVPYL